MVFGSTTYINTFVDSDAIFFVDSSIIGVIAGVAGTNNTTIAAIVCNNGQIIDLFGFESDLSFTCDTGVFPGYTTPEGLTGMSESYNAGQTSIPAFQLRNADVGDSNAIIEIDGQAQDGYLTN